MRKDATTFNAETEYYRKEWQDYYPLVIKLVPPGTKVLDIGSGRGALAAYLKDSKGCDVTANDVNDKALAICRKKGLKTAKFDLESGKIPGAYDVIVLSAVLEHLVDPLAALEKLKKSLKKDGRLVILVPNFSFWAARILYMIGRNAKRFGQTRHERRMGIQPYAHLQFFNRRTLRHCLEKTGYTVERWAFHEFFTKIPVPFAMCSSMLAVRAKR